MNFFRRNNNDDNKKPSVNKIKISFPGKGDPYEKVIKYEKDAKISKVIDTIKNKLVSKDCMQEDHEITHLKFRDTPLYPEFLINSTLATEYDGKNALDIDYVISTKPKSTASHRTLQYHKVPDFQAYGNKSGMVTNPYNRPSQQYGQMQPGGTQHPNFQNSGNCNRPNPAQEWKPPIATSNNLSGVSRPKITPQIQPVGQQQQKPQHQIPQHQIPQHQIPQHQIPQHQIPQHQIPQHQIPQHQIPQHQIPQQQKPQHQIPQHQIPQHQIPQQQNLQPINYQRPKYQFEHINPQDNTFMTKSNMKSQLFILKTIEAESKLKLNPKQTVSEHEETIRKHYLSDDVAILCFPGGSFADKTYHEFKERNNNTDKFMYYVSFVSKSKIDLNDKQEHHVRLSTCNELLGDCYDPKYPQLICCFLKYCRKLLSFN